MSKFYSCFGIISIDPALLERCAMDGKSPKCILVVKVETVFFQCARAIRRSNLWQPVASESLAGIPSPGTMLEALTDAQIDGQQYDHGLGERQRTSLY
ncbi:MAG: pyridoxamine 5'-phosphate oxidase-like FMN-binding protein [Comamonadaceae bacterium]|nr:MAG: pyridoxamine 5'-phosphate oxidase-like FMN-binding protein [Comamonadaceae bacterium]